MYNDVHMKVAEFRKDLSNCLDRAVQGETIKIERAGQTFNLELANPVERITKRVKAIQESKQSPNIPMLDDLEPDPEFTPPDWLIKQTAANVVRQSNPKAANMFDKDIQFCQHGAVKGMCKKGCK